MATARILECCSSIRPSGIDTFPSVSSVCPPFHPRSTYQGRSDRVLYCVPATPVPYASKAQACLRWRGHDLRISGSLWTSWVIVPSILSPLLLFSCNVHLLSCSHPFCILHSLLAFFLLSCHSFFSICCTQVLQNHLKVLRGRCHVKTSAVTVDPFLLLFLEVMRPLTGLPRSTLAQN